MGSLRRNPKLRLQLPSLIHQLHCTRPIVRGLGFPKAWNRGIIGRLGFVFPFVQNSVRFNYEKMISNEHMLACILASNFRILQHFEHIVFELKSVQMMNNDKNHSWRSLTLSVDTRLQNKGTFYHHTLVRIIKIFRKTLFGVELIAPNRPDHHQLWLFLNAG